MPQSPPIRQEPGECCWASRCSRTLGDQTGRGSQRQLELRPQRQRFGCCPQSPNPPGHRRPPKPDDRSRGCTKCASRFARQFAPDMSVPDVADQPAHRSRHHPLIYHTTNVLGFPHLDLWTYRNVSATKPCGSKGIGGCDATKLHATTSSEKIGAGAHGKGVRADSWPTRPVGLYGALYRALWRQGHQGHQGQSGSKPHEGRGWVRL